MSGTGKVNNAVNIAMGVLMTICLSLSSFTLKELYAANAQRQVMKVQLKAVQDALSESEKKSDLDKKQDSQISKHWKLHSWAKQMIDEGRFARGEGPSTFPDLTIPGE